MIRRTLIFLLLCCMWGVAALAQVDCTTSTKLVCQIPVATRATAPGTVGDQAQAFNASFAAQLSQLPLPSSATGIVLVFDKSTNDYKVLDNLGPILTDRARTIGKRRLYLGFSFQQFNFNSANPPVCTGPTRLPGGLQYDVGADAKLFQRVTVATDLFGNQFQNSPTLVQVSYPITTIPPISPPQTVTRVNSTYTINDFSVGLKWKPLKDRNLLVYGNVLFQLNNVGLRSSAAPLFGLSYTFCSPFLGCQK